MKMLFSFFTTILIACTLSACTHGQSTTQVATNFIQRQHVVAKTNHIYPAKNPQNIAFFSEEKSPHAPYRIIASAKISKHNLLGMQRQDQTMENMMKKLAASIGGDGVIDVNKTQDGLEANVIAFQKILI